MIYRRDENGEVHEPKKRGKFEEESYRDLAHSLGREELEWMVDELKKLGKVKAVILC